MTVCATQAQTANDSVRIKLQTTAGADIAIDGDWSSTNIMYTKVATGQHNITVRYGSLFEKNYRLYRYCPWMRGMATSQISCNNGIDKKASHVPL